MARKGKWKENLINKKVGFCEKKTGEFEQKVESKITDSKQSTGTPSL